jgi:WD40 repeat protein
VFAPDGKKLITAGPDRKLAVWEVPSGKMLSKLGPLTKQVTRLTLSRDGQTLAGSDLLSEQLSLWSLSGNAPSARHDWPSGLALLHNVSLAPDGLTLFVGGPGAQSVRVFDISAPTQPRRLPDLDDSDGPVAVSTDGRWLATPRANGLSLRLWSLPSLAPVATKFLPGGRLYSLKFSPSSDTLAVGQEDGQITLWSVNSNREPARLLGHERQVVQMDFSPDGATLVSASLDGTVRLWDVRTGERANWIIPVGGIVCDVNFSPDSKMLVSGSQAVIRSATGEFQRLCVVQLWDVDRRKGLISRTTFTNTTVDLTCQVSFSPDGAIVVTDDYVKLRFLRVPALTPIFEAGSHLPRWDTNGQRLFYVDQNRIICRHSKSGEPTEVARPGDISALALSPDGRTLATVSHHKRPSIELRNTSDGSLLAPPLNGHENWVDWLAFSPDGNLLASAGWKDGSLGIWDVAKRKGVMLRAHNGSVIKLAFSPDGITLATCGSDNAVRLWNVARLQEVAVLQSHRGLVNSVAFSPDGRWLASASSDGTIHLWSAPTLEEISAVKAP